MKMGLSHSQLDFNFEENLGVILQYISQEPLRAKTPSCSLCRIRQEEVATEERDSGLSGVESGQLRQSEWQWPQSAMWSK